MGMGVLHKRLIRSAAIVALAGIALYAILVPGHIVSQAMLAAGTGGEPICHDDDAKSDHPGHSGPEDPKPDKNCPFCKGYATFLTAFSGGASSGILDAGHETPLVFNPDGGLLYVVALAPQNRGPPIEL